MKKNKIRKKVTNYLILFLGFFSIIGISFATITIWDITTGVNRIETKNLENNNTVSSTEFNNIVGILKNIYNQDGKIGIGTGPNNDLIYALEVQGGIIKATDGLILENNNTNTSANTELGQIWFLN